MATASAVQQTSNARPGGAIAGQRPSDRPVARTPRELVFEQIVGDSFPRLAPDARRSVTAEPTGPSAEAIVALVRMFVIAHISRKLEPADLVGAAGVSATTLRRAVAARTGMQLAQFVLAIRLEQARAWLSSNRESRSLTQIARALSFQSPSAFCRAYRRHFGEGMSVTRRRAVRLGEMSLSLANKAPDRP